MGKSSGSYAPYPIGDPVSGPDGTIWFTGQVNGKSGIGRISTRGTFKGILPEMFIEGDLVPLPNGQVFYLGDLPGQEQDSTSLGIVSPSGRISAQEVVDSYLGNDLSVANIALGPDGNLWFTEMAADRIARRTTSGVLTQFAWPPGPSHPYA